VAATCQTIALAASETDVTFTVAATNKAGEGAQSAPSGGFRSFIPPGPVSSVTKQDRDNACLVSFSPAALNGARSSEVVYNWRASNGAQGNFGSSTNGTATGLPNNSVYSIDVWAVTTAQGVSYPGPATRVTGCTPYGQPNVPGVSASPSGTQQVQLNWSMPGRNGRDIVAIEISVDGGAWQNKGTSGGSVTVGNNYSQNHTIKARVKDAAEQYRESGTANATSNPAPPPWVTFEQTGDSTGTIKWGNIHGTYPIKIYKNGVFTGCTFSTGTTEQCLTTYDMDQYSSMNTNRWVTENGWRVKICINGTCSPEITWRRPF
jgi:hypothetical protein